MKLMQWSARWFAILGLAGLLAGCGRTTTTSPGPSGGPATPGTPAAVIDPGPFTGGKQVFASNGCARCHTVNGVRLGSGGGPPMAGGPKGGPPGGPRKGGPDLGHVGKEPSHTVEWLVQYVSDPRSVREEARMPAFGNKLSAPDLHALAEYLASLQ